MKKVSFDYGKKAIISHGLSPGAVVMDITSSTPEDKNLFIN